MWAVSVGLGLVVGHGWNEMFLKRWKILPENVLEFREPVFVRIWGVWTSRRRLAGADDVSARLPSAVKKTDRGDAKPDFKAGSDSKYTYRLSSIVGWFQQAPKRLIIMLNYWLLIKSAYKFFVLLRLNSKITPSPGFVPMIDYNRSPVGFTRWPNASPCCTIDYLSKLRTDFSYLSLASDKIENR